MKHEEFLQHGWVTSKIDSIAAKQKERERQYNRDYYRMHSDKWNRSSHISWTIAKPTNASEAEQIERERQRKFRELGRQLASNEKQTPLYHRIKSWEDRTATSISKYLRSKKICKSCEVCY